MRFPSQAQKKTRKSRFQIEKIIDIIFQRLPSQAKKTRKFRPEVPITSPEKTRKSRRYWHYFLEKPKKTRKSRFQMRFPSQAKKKTRKFRFQIEDIGIIFQRFPSQAQKRQRKSRFQIEDIGIMRFPSQAHKKTRKFRFQIEDIDIIFQRLPSQAVFKWGSHHRPKKTTEIPFSNRRYWHYFPEVPITSPEKNGNTFSNRRYWPFSRKAQKDTD